METELENNEIEANYQKARRKEASFVKVLPIIIFAMGCMFGGGFINSIKSDKTIKEMNIRSMIIGSLIYQNIDKSNLSKKQIDSVFTYECNKVADDVWSE